MNFAALEIILQVDDIYTECVQDMPFREILRYRLPTWNVTRQEFEATICTLSKGEKCMNIYRKIMMHIY